jgi:hypothetical protein
MLHLKCSIGGLPQLVHQVWRVLLQQLLHGRLVKALWNAQFHVVSSSQHHLGGVGWQQVYQPASGLQIATTWTTPAG